jgi:hypothetical protein
VTAAQPVQPASLECHTEGQAGGKALRGRQHVAVLHPGFSSPTIPPSLH